MMNKTKIEWCDSTWNPVTGCLHNCEYCYARKIANRFKGHTPDENPDTVKCLQSGAEKAAVVELSGMQARKQKNGKIVPAPYPFGFTPTLHKYRLDEPQKLSEPHTIFVCSMADLFGEWVPDKWIDDVIDACKKAPQHRYLFLTKNPKRYAELDGGKNMRLPPKSNMWYGATTTNCKQLSAAIKSFGKLSSNAKNFLSVEPILEDITQCEEWRTATYYEYANWVIIGAETGGRKDKAVPKKDWIDNIVKDCVCNDIPVFMKDSLLPIMGEKNMRREFPW